MSDNITLGLVLSMGLGASFAQSTKTAQKLVGNIDTSLTSLKKQKIDVKQFQQLSRYGAIGAQAIKKLDTQLKINKIDTKNLTKETQRLNRSMLSLRKIRKIDFNISGAKQKLVDLKTSALAVVGIGYSINKLYSSAAETLKAQGEIKTLGMSPDGVNAITKAGHKMAMQYGQITAPAFIKASYDIKSGIASLSDAGVNNFTKLAATTAIATKSSTEEMTKLYALGYGIFRKDFTSDNKFGEQFSGAIATAVKEFRTDGSDLAQGFSNIGAAASSMGVTLAQQLSVIGVSKSSFSSASEAATAYRSFLDNVGKAQDSLGVSFTDASGKMLKMPQVLEVIKGRFNNLEDVTQSDALKDAFGSSEAVKLIKGLIGKTDELTASEIKLGNAMSRGAEQSKKMATLANQGYGAERLGNSFEYIGFTIGKVLEPSFNGLASATAFVANGIAWLDSTFPMLTTGMLTIGGLALGLTAGFKAWKIASVGVSIAKWGLAKNLESVKLATIQSSGAISRNTNLLSLSSLKMGGLAAKTKLFTGAQWLLNVAMNANPIALVITGVSLLAGGLFFLYKKSKPVRAFLDGFGRGFMQGFAPVINSFKSLGSIFTVVSNGFGKLFGWVGKVFPSLSGISGELGAIGSAGEMVGAILGKGFSLALKPLTLLMDGVGWLSGKLNSWLGSEDTSAKGDALPSTKPLDVSYTRAEPKVMQNSYNSVRPQQNNQIQVVVHNPKDTVEVERAIVNAMAHPSSNVPLADQEF